MTGSLSALFPVSAWIAAGLIGALLLIWKADHSMQRGEIEALQKCLRDLTVQKEELTRSLEASNASVKALQAQLGEAWQIAEQARKKARERQQVMQSATTRKAGQDEVLDETSGEAVLRHIGGSLDGLRK